jgi:hypothetical protein
MLKATTREEALREANAPLDDDDINHGFES